MSITEQEILVAVRDTAPIAAVRALLDRAASEARLDAYKWFAERLAAVTDKESKFHLHETLQGLITGAEAQASRERSYE
jgi:hypothetical protein